MNFDNIPDVMKEFPNWVLWQLETRNNGSPTKVPYAVHGGYAKVNDPSTWTSFDEVIQAFQSEKYSGIGFMFNNTPFIGVDIDGCINESTEAIQPEALDALEIMQSYTELSQSKHGFHVILEGKLPSGRRRNGAFEMYGEGSSRYFAMTGNVCGDSQEVRADQEAIDAIHRKYIQPSVAPQQKADVFEKIFSLELSDEEIIERASNAKNGIKFTRLWDGDTSDYGNDHSCADMALCDLLAFWCQRDPVRMDRLFRQSVLMRSKWDEKRGQNTYGQITIQTAINKCKEILKGNAKSAAQDLKEWEPPEPFTRNLPAFPIQDLPSPLAAYVKALAESTQTAPEMAGVLALGVLASAFQSKYEVQITSDWTEPLCLYLMAIAKSAERKSAVIKALLSPAFDYEKARREAEAGELARAQSEKKLLEMKLHKAKRGTKNKCDPEFDQKEVFALAERLEEFKDKHSFRLFVEDTTPEKLIDLMDKQGGCITVASAEGGGIFDAFMGRYSKGPNINVYLQGHAGDRITVDRMGRETNIIHHPRLTMMLAVQPQVLKSFLNNEVSRERGLCARFLYVLCGSRVGYRTIGADPIPSQVKEDYKKFIQRIFSSQSSGTIQVGDADGYKVFFDYNENIEKRLRGEWEYMCDWGGKLVGTMLRIAALIHAAEIENPTEVPISSKAMLAAVSITEYLAAHAMAVFQSAVADKSYVDAKYLLGRIEAADGEEISKRDLFNNCKGKFKKVEEMEPSLQMLVDMGYVQLIEEGTGGRPTTTIMINPMSKMSKMSKSRL